MNIANALRFGRLKYRLYRNPFVMFVLGASYLFMVRHRLTIGIPKGWRRERRGVHLTNLGLARDSRRRLVHDRACRRS